MNKVYLKPGKTKALANQHPWVFSGAIQRVEGKPDNGEVVEICTEKGEFLAVGAYSPFSQIRLRVWSFKKEKINADFIRRRIQNAIQRRKTQYENSSDTAFRLVHGESDLLPGLIVDQYDTVLVVQFLSSGAVYFREAILTILKEETGIHNIYERSDVEVRSLEGLPKFSGVVSGDVPDEIIIREDRYQFIVEAAGGQKTGFYLDQRDNRKLIGDYCKEKSVLNFFSFTGGFSVYASGNGASKVTSVDSSQPAMDLAKRNYELNGYDVDRSEWVVGDAFQVLRNFREAGRTFDVVILDPPKFASTAAQVKRAARGYKDINLLGFKLLNPGGVLVTFSCSGGITDALFQKIVADAALDAGVQAVIERKLTQGRDHPVNLNFPEGSYLKGFVCRVI
ncbi:MAG: 23S rRNA (cytosine(1962)-C(5))-methyltransferase RlmI [Anaerolineaceae bacterium]|nr:23S rRNA (cytosine(1962)-C(5))-methyltransferase RlmI [Anaerolineaceae bacterium]